MLHINIQRFVFLKKKLTVLLTGYQFLNQTSERSEFLE